MSRLSTENQINHQKMAENVVKNHIYCNQTLLVEDAFKNSLFSYDEVENLKISSDEALSNLLEDGYKLFEITAEMLEDAQTYNSVYEWWLVSQWLANELSFSSQPVLQNDYGYWWGRTCSGQSIYMDEVIQKIALYTS